MKNNTFLLIIVVLLCSITNLHSQVGINTQNPDHSAILDIYGANKGFLITRVPLQSKADITTIPNPVKGMIVLSTVSSGTGNLRVTEGYIYKYNGATWDELLEENNNSVNFLYPKIIAAGVKNTTTTTCTNSTQGNFALINSTAIDGNILSSTGALTASRKGYYYWSISIRQFMLKGAYNPVLFPGMLSYAFQDGTSTTRSWQTTAFSGGVYLEQGATSEGFTWSLGDGNSCNSADRIGEQRVVWIYMGE